MVTLLWTLLKVIQIFLKKVTRVLHHIGIILSDMGEIEGTMRLYKDSLQKRRLILSDEHKNLARMLHKLGLIYYDSRNYNQSLKSFNDGLWLGKKKVGQKSKKVTAKNWARTI